jgi:hypothetical protein
MSGRQNTVPKIVIAVGVFTYLRPRCGSCDCESLLRRRMATTAGRPELVCIGGERGTFDIRIPGAPHWLAAKRAGKAYDGLLDGGGSEIELAGRIINTALGALITMRFVVSRLASCRGRPGTLEGIIHVGISSSSTAAQLAIVTRFGLLLNAIMSLVQQEHLEFLKSAMSAVTDSFVEPDFDVDRPFIVVCQKLEGQTSSCFGM